MSESNSTGSHFSMADVSEKAPTKRVAVASGLITLGEKAFGLLKKGELPKGDPLAMAEIAGVMAAKQTPKLIPLCHPISLSRASVHCELRPERFAVEVYCVAEITERTGVEMEALTGLQIALLTIWDLVKPVNAELEISDTRLLYKSGGKRGLWKHSSFNESVLPLEVSRRL
ncbi:MAG: cyclic pyranopterin monophosphate synthase MoaC [bacterium]